MSTAHPNANVVRHGDRGHHLTSAGREAILHGLRTLQQLRQIEARAGERALWRAISRAPRDELEMLCFTAAVPHVRARDRKKEQS